MYYVVDEPRLNIEIIRRFKEPDNQKTSKPENNKTVCDFKTARPHDRMTK